MIKLIIFDLGGVLIPERGQKIKKEICKYLNIPKKQFLTFGKIHHKGLTIGKITLLKFYSLLVKRFKIKIKPRRILEKHMELYKKYSKEKNQSIIKLIKNLKKNHKVVALTNTEIEIATYNKKRSLFAIFDKAFISTKIHQMKPKKLAYTHVLSTMHCLPNQAIFIDDKKDYTSSAKKVGISAILFKSPHQLANQIKSLTGNKNHNL